MKVDRNDETRGGQPAFLEAQMKCFVLFRFISIIDRLPMLFCLCWEAVVVALRSVWSEEKAADEIE